MEMNMGKFSEKLVELLELAKKKKNVLEYQEINDFFKDQPLGVEQMEKVFDFLEASGVDVLRITDSEEQREVASLFNATIHLENQQEQDQAFADTLLRIKSESLAERNRNWDPTDMAGLQQIVKAKKELEELGRKRRELHISFE